MSFVLPGSSWLYFILVYNKGEATREARGAKQCLSHVALPGAQGFILKIIGEKLVGVLTKRQRARSTVKGLLWVIS